MAKSSLLYAGSVAAHVALAVGVGRIDRAPRSETIAITMHEDAPKPPAEAKIEPPKQPDAPAAPAPRAPVREAAKAAPAAAPPPAEAPAAAAPGGEALPDFGFALSGGVGGSGPSLRSGPSAAAGNGTAPKAVAPRPKALAPRPEPAACSEPVTKPKPVDVRQPAYTTAAREARIEGRVRVELTVDETGRVKGARVLAGLGFGLDEAATAAATASTFEPALRCGKPVSSTFVIGMRFSL